jgi:hypothetical protein
MELIQQRHAGAETLADPEGRVLGRVVAPRPGPVVGRASGTVYLDRPLRPSGAGRCEERGYRPRR